MVCRAPTGSSMALVLLGRPPGSCFLGDVDGEEEQVAGVLMDTHSLLALRGQVSPAVQLYFRYTSVSCNF